MNTELVFSPADWPAISLLRPWWLLALLPLALALWWARSGRRQSGEWARWIDAPLLQFLSARYRHSRGRNGSAGSDAGRPWLCLSLCWLVLVLALSGPAVQRPLTQAFAREQAQVILLDLSPSMAATDIKPNRLVRARLKILDWLKAHNEGHSALLVYGGSAHVVVPFAQDNRVLTALTPTLNTGLVPVPGSEPLAAFELIEQLRQNAGFASVDVLWLTDGIAADQSAALANRLRALPLRVGIIAIGTEDGAPIPVPVADDHGVDQRGASRMLTDSAGRIVIAKLDYPGLARFASAAGARLSPLTADDSDWQQMSWPLDTSATVHAERALDSLQWQSLHYQDLGAWLLWLLLPLAAIAYGRHGRQLLGLLPVLLCCAASLLAPAPAEAASWRDLWQTKDQQGAAALNAGDNKTAAETFARPDWQGIARYKNGEHESAAERFAQAGRPLDQYNQGMALARAGKLTEAQKAFDSAYQREPTLTQARDNSAAIADYLRKQTPKKPDGKNAQSQDSNADNAQNSDQNSEQNSENNSGNNSEDKSGQNAQQYAEQDANKKAGENSAATSADKPGQPSESNQKQNQAEQNAGQTAGTDKVKPPQNRRDASADRTENTDKSDANAAERKSADAAKATDQEKSAAAQAAAKEKNKAAYADPKVKKLLEQLPDDPGALLRNRMKLEWLKRQQNNANALQYEPGPVETAPPLNEHW